MTALREQVAEALWTTAESRIIAEWICCEPLQEGHDLCAQGYAALRMVRDLIADDPNKFPERGELTDAVLRVPAIAEALAAVAAVERVRTILDRDQDGLCCSHVTGQIRAALDQPEQS